MSSQAVAQTNSESSSEEPPSGDSFLDPPDGLWKSRETINIFSGVIWATAYSKLAPEAWRNGVVL